LPFIISLGEPLRGAPAHDDRIEPYQGFVAGLHDSYATTEFTSQMSGIQIDFTPLGLRMLLGGIPMHELVNRMVHLEDLLGSAGRDLIEQLQEDPDWDARFDRMEAFIARRLKRAPLPAEDVAFAWHRLEQTAGCINVGALANEMGYSRKQLIARFRTHVGLTPKLAARVFRFRNACDLVSEAEEVNWSDIAFDAGYYDQSHLIRDFVQFSGSSPTDYAARLLPDSGGMRAD
jgi:AraC-like DNA-binding protein